MMAISDALFRLIYGVDRNEHMQLEEMLGYTFENDVPSALGQVEPFDASRHRFQIGAKVLHRQRELTFTVMGRINDMVRLQGLDDNEKKQIFYYPEQSKQLVLEGTPPTPPSSTRKGGTRPDKAVWHELLSAAGVNNGGRDGGTVMPTTLSEHRLAQLKSLLKRAGPDTVRAAFDPGENVELVYSVLHWVSQKDMGNYFKVGELLLTHGANPDPYDINGTTPLYLACVYGQSEVVRFLVRNGADVLRPSAGLLTPAHLLLDDGFNISKTLVVECLRSRRELIKDEVSATKTVNFDFTWLDHATVKPPLNFWFSDGDVGPWKNHVGGMSLLEVAVKTGSIEALEAPVVRRYIQHHWTLYARQGAIFDFGAALLLTGAVVLDTWFTPPRLADTHSLGWEVLPATLILVWAALLFAYELYSLVHKPKIWLIDKWNPVELLTYSLLVAYESCDLLAGLGMALAAEASTLTCLQAFSALFVWVRLLKYVGLFEKYGHYVSIIVKMLSEFTIFLVVVAAIYAGFTHAFYVLLMPTPGAAALAEHADGAGVSPLVLVGLLVFNMLVGDFDIELYTASWALIVVFVGFVLLGTVLLLNLLIAQLSNVYEEVQQSAQAQWLLNKARLILEKADDLPLRARARYSCASLTYEGVRLPTDMAESLYEEEQKQRLEARERYLDDLVAEQYAAKQQSGPS